MPSSPDDFKDEIEQDAAEGQEFVEEAAQETAPPELAAMASMAETAESDAAPDVEPAEAPFAPEIADPPLGVTPVEPESDVAPPELASMADMAETATEDIGLDPPEVEAMADMASTAAADVPQPTQKQQIKESLDQQRHEQFEFDVGAFEADMGGMDLLEAETSYRETNYAWQKLMTQIVIDHQHRLEQLLAMLERER